MCCFRGLTVFQSTPPVKAATVYGGKLPAALQISIHAAREGGDRKHLFKNSRRWRISIHAAREGGDLPDNAFKRQAVFISIHAAREGGDIPQYRHGTNITAISIHAAREGGDVGNLWEFAPKGNFNPRRP